MRTERANMAKLGANSRHTNRLIVFRWKHFFFFLILIFHRTESDVSIADDANVWRKE